MVERALAGELIEVSVGAISDVEHKSGIFNGKRYAGIWRNISSDHFAMLPLGMTGACSIEMGGGAPRAASKGKAMKNQHGAVVIGAAIEVLSEHGQSDIDLREKLRAALHDTVAGFDGIVAVFPDDGLVIYHVFLEDEWSMRR